MGSFLSSNEKIIPTDMDDISRRQFRNHAISQHISFNRKTTDVVYFLFMALFYAFLVCLLIYCICYGNFHRILNGYDNCGNVCGLSNVPIEEIPCSGINMTTRPFLLIRKSGDYHNNSFRQCVTSCKSYSNYTQFLNRCIPKKTETVVNTIFSKTGLKNFFQEVSEDLQVCWREILYLGILALVFSCIIMVLLRFLVGIVVWMVLVGVCIACGIGTIYLWALYNASNNYMDSQVARQISDIEWRRNGTCLVFAIAATIITACVILIIFVIRKRIQLVIQLFKEAGKAVTMMPLLLLEPLLTFIFLTGTVSLCLYLSIWIESAGFIERKKENVIHYQKNFLIKFTRWYNVFGMLWMCQFIVGCQHVVIAGAVSTWYFTRNKNNLEAPILQSTYTLTRYHLGSVAIGSFIIAVVQLARVILKTTQMYLNGKEGKPAEYALRCCQCCLHCFDIGLKYLSRNAYIEIAIYGYSFCKAGKQAFKLLVSNAFRVGAINSIGDFVLFLGKVLVVVATVLTGVEILEDKEGVQHFWVPIILVGLFAYFISHCFISVYEMSIDTIFLCFCEDCEQNDGINKPYYMSKGLMEFVENSKKALQVFHGTNAITAWQEGPQTISKAV